MPYIDPQRRIDIQQGSHPINAGELNYALTTVIKTYLKDKDLRYSTINDIMGALEGAKMEFYERVVRPYENKKIKDNGDCY